MTPTLKLLRELIALPSVNPGLLPAGDPRAGEQRVAEFLAATAGAAGLDVDLREVQPGRCNLFTRLSPAGKVKHRVVLAPHLDTVPPATDEQFDPQVRQGRVYGRGACDTKGSVAAMFSAVLELARQGARPAHTEIVFIGLVDEETGQAGSRAVAADGFDADLAIVGEPTRLRVVTAHKGNVWLKLTTQGKAAHGSRPDLGRNAILEMARVVTLLETEYAAELATRRHPLLRCATVNTGTIRGGVQANIVPAQCSIVIDRRMLPGETGASVRRELKALLRAHGLKAVLGDQKGAPCPALETDANLPLVRGFMALAGQAEPVGVDYFCDAAVLAGAGIPSVVFGPGDIAQAHTADEWLATSQLERAKTLLVRFLSGLA